MIEKMKKNGVSLTLHTVKKTPADTTSQADMIKTASLIALLGNSILAVVKIGFGLHTGSLALLGDGMDSSVDVLIALLSFIVAGVIARPADAGHPWGHGRAETVATALLSFSLFFAGAQLILNSGSTLVSTIQGTSAQVPEAAAIGVSLFSIIGKSFLAWILHWFGTKAQSAMLKANGKNMSADVVLSLGVLLGLVLSRILGMWFIDSVSAILVGFWIIKSAIVIFIETNGELMDGGSGKESYQAVFEAVHSVKGAGNPHRTRMRRIAGYWDIDIDIEVDPRLTVREAHKIASTVERAIKERVEHVYDIMVHVEPIGDSQKDTLEGYGLCEQEL
ncbi:MAG: cation diffusion facilitator family transporter [Treponema sp.]|nr:cation diffusion facilitator family transporter [Treponema sp.]